jgi:hypothetical protein
MTVQISQRGKEFRDTTDFSSPVKAMTDPAIAGQLKAPSDDYQRRAEKAWHVDADG